MTSKHSRLIFLSLVAVFSAIVAVAAGQPTRVVKSDSARLRAAANASSNALGLLTKFEPVEVVSTSGSWVRVKAQSGTTGFVAARDLSERPFVSTSARTVNVRSGPGANDPTVFVLRGNYPLRVLGKQGNRIRVVDFEGDGGWVHENLISFTPYVIAKERVINLREGPSVNHARRFTADRGAVFEVLEEKDGWLRVRYSDGDEAWCSARIVWGWLP